MTRQYINWAGENMPLENWSTNELIGRLHSLAELVAEYAEDEDERLPRVKDNLVNIIVELLDRGNLQHVPFTE